MKNPLRKRIKRELKRDFGKYLVIFLLLGLMISFVSGYIVSDNSMLEAYHKSFHANRIENGHFSVNRALNIQQKQSIEKQGITLYDLSYAEEKASDGDSIRMFANREQVNLPSVMKGRLPKKKGEMAIDRLYASNNHIQVGDRLRVGTRNFSITGLVALSDYTALFEKNEDAMLNALTFGTAVVTKQDFSSFKDREKVIQYAWRYHSEPKTEAQEKKRADALLKRLNRELTLSSYVPRYQNQAIRFAGDDLSKDMAMMRILLYLSIALIAFIYGIITVNTIQTEAGVIGTLRASGYRKGELIRHYLALPLIVTFVSAITGNILGYTYFTNTFAGLYYNSYSLPTFEILWSMDALIETTLIPMALMFIVNIILLIRLMRISPLQFLRRELRVKKQKQVVGLHKSIPFLARFSLRVIGQNLSNYFILFLGIIFVNLILLFGLGLPDMLQSYRTDIQTNRLSNYQYMLKIPVALTKTGDKWSQSIAMYRFQKQVDTENKDAEAFSAYTLKAEEEKIAKDEITLYGISPNSRYISVDTSKKGVYITSGYAEKYKLKTGDTIRLKELYEDKSYQFEVAGIYPYSGSLAVFMEKKTLNKTFDLGEGYFAGYFSDSKITDIDQEAIGSVIEEESLLKMSDQLDKSMGSIADMVCIVAIVMFAVVMYLLCKIIIDKNATSISMTKVLGYHNNEIGKLYLLPTSVVAVICLLLAVPIDMVLLKQLFMAMMRREMTGWIPFHIHTIVYYKCFLLGIVAYTGVVVFEMLRIRKVPMSDALKHID